MILHSGKALREKCPLSEFLWSVFSRIRNDYGEIRVSPCIQSEYGRIRIRKTPNTDTFHAVKGFDVVPRYFLPLENFDYFFFCCMKVINRGPVTMETF